MTDEFVRGGHIRLSWQDRFRDKWPYMTTLMYQNGGDGMDTTNGSTLSMDNTHRGPPWPQPHHEMWTERSNLDHDKAGSDTFSAASKKGKGCARACNIALCAFLFITIITAVCAGVGLAILLNGGDDDTDQHSGMHGDSHLDGFLTPEEEIYMSRKFCDLVRVFMRSTNYPLKEGIDHCYANLRLIKGSEELHIEMHVLPTDKYTMKEKFRRALRENILAEGSYRINGTDKCLKTTSGFPLQKCSGGRISSDKAKVIFPTFHDSSTPHNSQNHDQTTGQAPTVVTEQLMINRTVPDNINYTEAHLSTAVADIQPSVSEIATASSSSVTVLMPSIIWNASEAISNIEITTTPVYTSDKLPVQPTASSLHHMNSEISTINSIRTSSVSSVITATPVANPLDNQKIISVGDGEVSRTQLSPSLSSFTTAILMTSNELPSSIKDFPPLTSTVISTSSIKEEPTLQTSEIILTPTSGISSTPNIVSISSSSLNYPSTDLRYSSLASSLNTKIIPSSSTARESIPSKYVPPKPFQTVAKTEFEVPPNLIRKTKHETTTRKVERQPTVQKPRVVENLMLGGVLRLPFKTTSRFRFLFADNSDRRAASPVLNTIAGAEDHLKGPVTTTRRYKIVSNKNTAKVRFENTDAVGTDRNIEQKKANKQSVITNIPIPPPIFSADGRNSQQMARTLTDDNINNLQGRESGNTALI